VHCPAGKFESHWFPVLLFKNNTKSVGEGTSLIYLLAKKDENNSRKFLFLKIKECSFCPTMLHHLSYR
jgi:hypothetical protein